MSISTPLKPKSPIKTCSQRMGWLFGPPRTNFEPKILPRDIDVIQVWMSCSDSLVGGKKFTSELKVKTLNQTVGILSDHMKDFDKDVNLMEKKPLTTKVRRLVARADDLIRSNQAK